MQRPDAWGAKPTAFVSPTIRSVVVRKCPADHLLEQEQMQKDT